MQASQSMEQTSMDRWCTTPQAAAFSGPWSKHLWTGATGPAPGRCILRPIEQTFVDRWCTPPQAAGFSGSWGNICGPLVHPSPGRCILRSMEETFVDRWCTPPQDAAFSGPWRKHLWTAGTPRPRPLHSQVYGANICGPLVFCTILLNLYNSTDQF